jgi:hypothetical protein
MDPKLPVKRQTRRKIRRASPRLRGWLIFAGIIVVFFALSLLKFRMRVLFSKAGLPLLLIGVAIVVLTLMKRKRPDKR